MIDLHTHTTESDGSCKPSELILMGKKLGLEAIAITDHETFAGYFSAIRAAFDVGLELVCGVELATRFHDQSVHVLAYFLNGIPTDQMQEWVKRLQDTRHLRNRQLVNRLRSHKIRITVDEVYRRGGTLPGRPHFAAILAEKGYVLNPQHAFDLYLDETGSCFIEREEPAFAETIKRISDAGGLSSLAHPMRLFRQSSRSEELLCEMSELGLNALETYYSEHSVLETKLLLSMAEKFDLIITGGSDFHGASKPSICLGSGIEGELCVPRRVLDRMRNAPNAR